MRFVDLSVTIKDRGQANAVTDRLQIEYTDHQAGADQIQQLFGVGRELLRDREGWAVEELNHFSTHGSTHVDAPYHYNQHVNGAAAETIDQMPLDWFFRDGVVLDMTAKEDGDPLTAAEAEAELARIGYQLKPRDIVLIHTGCDKHYDEPDYMFRGCGVTAEATHWLYEQGIRVMGIDAWGWDRPLDRQATDALAENRPGIFWAAHQANLAYSQIERLANLDQLPPFGFRVACFPLKIHQGSAAPARAVAILDD